LCEAVFRKEKHKIFIKNAGVEADEENEERSSAMIALATATIKETAKI